MHQTMRLASARLLMLGAGMITASIIVAPALPTHPAYPSESFAPPVRRLAFDIEQGQKGPQATQVTPVAAAPLSSAGLPPDGDIFLN